MTFLMAEQQHDFWTAAFSPLILRSAVSFSSDRFPIWFGQYIAISIYCKVLHFSSPVGCKCYTNGVFGHLSSVSSRLYIN